jgi:hypothetical protein
MLADIDMNSNDILNVGQVSATELTVNGASVTASVNAAAESAANAALSEAAAEASVAAAALYAPAYYKDPAAFFAASTVWANNTRINARTGEVWDIVSSGEDFTHPASGDKVKVVAGGSISVYPSQFAAYPRFGGTTGRTTSTDCSVQMQKALDWVAAKNQTAGLRRFKLVIDDYYAATGLTFDSYCWIEQTVPAASGGIICPNSAAAGWVIQQANADIVGAVVKNLFINGNASNQSNAVGGFRIDLTGTTNTATLRDFHIEGLQVISTSGRGIHIGAFTRRSTFNRIRSYFAGEIGFYYAASDSILYDFDVSQSVDDGFVWAGSAGKIFNGKVWGAGRYVAASTSRGYSWEAGNAIIANCEAQENAGYGHSFFKSGQTLKGIVATGLTSDGDNVGATGTPGINVFNMAGCQIQAFVGKLNPALLGTPAGGMNIGGANTKGNVFDLTTDGISGFPWVIASDSTENDFRHNGDKIVSYTTIASSITPNSMSEGGFSGTLAANTTINNPARKVRGFRLRFWIKQDAASSYTVTWGSDFIVNTPLNRALSASTYFEFVSDGTNWIDVNPAPRLVQETATSRTLTLADAGKVFDNSGASARADFTLPAANTAAIGAVFEFMCLDTDGIRVIAPSGNTIRIAGTESASFGNATTTTIGSTLKIIRGNANKWVALSSSGTWTVT